MSVGRLIGVHLSTAITYIDGTGIAGNDNSAENLKTVSLPANSLKQVGDRLRIRTYFHAMAGAAITGTTSINGVPTADTIHAGGASFNLTECWVHYIDDTHANIIEQDAATGTGLGTLSAANVAGFSWSSAQNIVFAQSATLAQHLVLIAMIVDIFPKGYDS